MVDAQLTLGADVAVTAPPGVATSSNLAHRGRCVPGVSATTAVDHAYAYVGPDLQDTYGIDAATLTGATTLRDSYFIGGSAQTDARAAARHAGRRPGLEGDDHRLPAERRRPAPAARARPANGQVPRRAVPRGRRRAGVPVRTQGLVHGHQSRLPRAGHPRPGPNVVFASTRATPRRSPPGWRAVAPFGATVKNISNQVQQTTSSITTVDLNGISRIEEVFAVIFAAAAMGLFVALSVGERRHEFAAMAAVGASLRDVAVFLWSEAAIVLGASLLLAAGLGWLLSVMLVAMLQHVFDPPPDPLDGALAVPDRAGRVAALERRGRGSLDAARARADAARCDTSRAVTEPRILIAEDDAELRDAGGARTSRGRLRRGRLRDRPPGCYGARRRVRRTDDRRHRPPRRRWSRSLPGAARRAE